MKKLNWFRLIISSKNLTSSQKVILFCIWDHMDSELQAYPSRQQIKEVTGCEFHTITKATKRASELGYLEVGYVKDSNSQHRSMSYTGLISFESKAKTTKKINTGSRESCQYSFWRKSVFIRDKYLCQHCKVDGEVIHAHHIKPWSSNTKLRFKISNGITLCKSCHEIEHCGVK